MLQTDMASNHLSGYKIMTLPYEIRQAINTTRQFLLDLQSDFSAPEKVREEASRCLKYYPSFEVAAQVQEKKIEEQLIALGWTPPKHTSNLK
jgi:hypothetical protein